MIPLITWSKLYTDELHLNGVRRVHIEASTVCELSCKENLYHTVLTQPVCTGLQTKGKRYVWENSDFPLPSEEVEDVNEGEPRGLTVV